MSWEVHVRFWEQPKGRFLWLTRPVYGFQYRSDGCNFQAALTKRLEKFGLALNQSKTHLIEFGRFASSNRKEKCLGKPQTFDFLGFTHYCTIRRSDGGFSLGRKSIAKKMRSKLGAIKLELRKRINQDLYTQGRWLKSVVQGHYNYYAVPGNWEALDRFKTAISRLWFMTIIRRSQKSSINWKKITRLIRLLIPNVKILHPYPNMRLHVWQIVGAVCVKRASTDLCRRGSEPLARWATSLRRSI